MLDWIITAILLIIGAVLMITGLIKYLIVGFVAYLGIILFMYCFSRLYLWLLKFK